jgi:hypothetical protein
MDIVIPSHSIRNFSAALAALSKMGMDVYWEFSSVGGLSLRTINDAKSSYCHVKYQSTYFERCGYIMKKQTKKKKRPNHKNKQKKRRHEDDDDDVDNADDNDDTEERVTYRIASRTLTAIVRGRYKNKAACLRIQETADGNALSFEFGIEQSGTAAGGGGGTVLLTVVHEIPVVADAESLCTVIDQHHDASELVATPQVYTSLLDALATSVYAALIVRKDSSVSASSFSLLDCCGSNKKTYNGSAAVAPHEKKALKSETACDLDEFLDFDFVSNRDTMMNQVDDDDDDTNHNMPDDVNQEVILVFHIKEPKLFLQFCHSQQVSAVRWNFHWGGRPIVLVAEADSYRAELVLATLDHAKLTSLRTMEENQQSTIDATATPTTRRRTTATTPTKQQQCRQSQLEAHTHTRSELIMDGIMYRGEGTNNKLCFDVYCIFLVGFLSSLIFP